MTDSINKSTKDKVLLIVEDEKTLSDTLEDRLLSEGFEVLKATDGEKGLTLALVNHPDLILLDLLMPKVDGISMLKKLRGDSWGKSAPVIILTNVESSDKVADAIGLGYGDTFEYMLKTNWSLDDMVVRIKEKLDIK
jgi:DNA-binding response OmpR family regulator